MKWAITIWLLFSTSMLLSQDKELSPAKLSLQLVQNYKTEREKVTSIFHWISENIAYERPRSIIKHKNARQSLISSEDIPDEGALQSLTERVAGKVLQDRKAVCEGYARLFKSLCDHAGIESAIITGYARTKAGGPDQKFRSNHSWNAVKIDQQWWLLDVTWASGYMAWPSGDFVRHFDPDYFLSTPDKFIQHHYPDDLRWSLMDNPPVIPEFRTTPFRQRSFTKYGFTSFYPKKGIIETRLGDTIRLELETVSAERNLAVYADSIWDADALLQTPLIGYAQPVSPTNDSRIYYQYPVTSDAIQWLYVMYNNDAVLRYRVQIRKED